MSTNRLSTSFPVGYRISRPRNDCSARVAGGRSNARGVNLSAFREHLKDWKRLDFLQFGRGYIKFPAKEYVSKEDPLRRCCAEESLPGCMTLVGVSIPLWKDGLLFFRNVVIFFSILAASFSLWFGREVKKYVEDNLPSLSQHLGRELGYGKVHGSFRGITLQSCSVGSHSEEFSCGQIPKMKLRFRPFASLRRRKIVMDAVLFRPNILIAQKEDFSWLGIPPPSEDDLKRHSSSEEGIDYHTKTRRLAREKATARWYEDRKNAAKKAAELGYIIPQGYYDKLATADPTNVTFPFQDNGSTGSLFSINDGKLWKDQHSVDMGMDYVLKHAEFEKSFGKNVRSEGFKFWSKFAPGPSKGKREGRRKSLYEDTVTLKQRNLECSAKAALAFFRGLNAGGVGASAQESYASGSKSNIASIKHENLEKSEIFVKTSDGDFIASAYTIVDMEQSGKLCQENDPGSNYLGSQQHTSFIKDSGDNQSVHFSSASDPLSTIKQDINGLKLPIELSGMSHISDKGNLSEPAKLERSEHKMEEEDQTQLAETHDNSEVISDSSRDIAADLWGIASADKSKFQESSLEMTGTYEKVQNSIGLQPLVTELESPTQDDLAVLVKHLFGQMQKLTSYIMATYFSNLIESLTLDSVYFTEGTLMLLGYGDQEPREMDNVNGHVKFQNHYSCIHVRLSGCCREWRSDGAVDDGGHLSADVFVDILDQKWHANLKIRNLFVPLFERILELPITWSKGHATGEVHICMSEGEIFPNIYGQLDVHDLAFHILEAPSCFSDITANLCFRRQRIFLHNASGKFGDAPLEASGDFGINPEDGEFHLMCQVPSVEVNRLMKTFKMKPLLFSLAGSVTAVFNCQGPLDAPIFVGSGIISRKTPHLASGFPPSPANEAVTKNREAGAVAAFDHIPFSHVSANFTFNTDNCIADLYGMRATLLDGGEVRGAGTAWICPEAEVDDTAMDLNLSGNCFFDKVLSRYLPSVRITPPKIGELNGEAKLSGSLMKPRFDIKWAAPKAEDSFTDARGDIVISHDYMTVTSSAVSFDLYMKVQTSYPQYHLEDADYSYYSKKVPLIVEGLDVDLRLRGFDFSNMIFSSPLDTPRSIHLKATGRIKFLGKVVKFDTSSDGNLVQGRETVINKRKENLVGEVSLSGIKLNQLMVAPQLTGSLVFSRERMKLDATGRPDESMFIEVLGPLWSTKEEVLEHRPSFSVFLQKGQLRATINYKPQNMANLEVRYLPLDELELASLRGTIQKAEVQLNFQRRRGHGLLSVIHPKFSGVLGETLDVVARWSGDVITVEKTILEQASSRYELQGEYVLPGFRDRYSSKEKDGLIKQAMDGNLGRVISSMGRWRMRLEVPGAEISEMLPLARLLSRNNDPSVRSRSKELFMLSVQSIGFCGSSLRELLEEIRRSNDWPNEVALDEISLPGLGELTGRWHGSLDASGGGDGDTLAEFDFHGEDWEWGSYKTQKILAVGAYSNNNGLRLDNMFIQKDNATLHADGTVLGAISNLHFAVLNFPIGLLPKVVQVVDYSTADSLGSLWQCLAPIKGVLHMEGDLRGTLAKPECDVQVRLLDGAIGGIDLGRAEVVASLTSSRRFLFNANFEPVIQSGHVHIRGSVPIIIQDDGLEEEGNRSLERTLVTPGWVKENARGSIEENEKKGLRDKSEDGWDTQLAESLKDLNWNLLDDGEVKVDADIKDGGMMLLTAMSPYANWLNGYADINLQVQGTVEQPVLDGSASFHRATVSSPLLQKPLTNFGGTMHVVGNRLCIASMESRIGKGKIVIKGNLPLMTTESYPGDKVDMKCELLEVRAKNIYSGQVDSHVQVAGALLQPNISGRIKLSHGEAYLPHDKGNGDTINRLATRKPSFPGSSFGHLATSGHLSRFFGLQPASPSKSSAIDDDIPEAMDQVNSKPRLDVRLTDLRLFLGPELRIVYPLILNFAVIGDLELNGNAHPKMIRPKGVLTFENGDINLVATQVRLKRDHLNVAKFEPDVGLDPILDLVLVGSEWQFRIQSPASKWQDNLVVTSMRSVDQDALSASEAAKIFENQLAESLLERDGQLAFKKLATATLATLMPKIEGKGEFGQARWRLVYAPQIPSMLSVDPTVDPLKFLANNISLGAEVEVQLGKHLQASVIRRMKDSKMEVQWTLVYLLTRRLRVLFQSSPATRLLVEYSATSQG